MAGCADGNASVDVDGNSASAVFQCVCHVCKIDRSLSCQQLAAIRLDINGFDHDAHVLPVRDLEFQTPAQVGEHKFLAGRYGRHRHFADVRTRVQCARIGLLRQSCEIYFNALAGKLCSSCGRSRVNSVEFVACN